MVKKLLFVFLSFFLTVPAVWAATLASDYSVQIKAGQERQIAPLMITSTADQDIRSLYGVNLILDENSDVTWGTATPTMLGTAFDNGRVRLNVEVIYREGGKVLFIPVLEDFQAGDYLQVSGLHLKAGATGGEFRVGLDWDGDELADRWDIRAHMIAEGTDVKPGAFLDPFIARYKLKCPSGVPVSDSTCLWARIDLLFAQKAMSEPEAGVSLSEADLALMAKRRPRSEQRYQKQCVTAEEPAVYCKRLAEDLDKLSYFLD